MLSKLIMIEFAASGSETVVLKVFMCIIALYKTCICQSFIGLTVSGLIIFKKIPKGVALSRVLSGSVKQCSTYINQSTILKGHLSA